MAPAGPAAAQTACTPTTGFTDCRRYSYTGGDQTFTVPPGVTSVQARLWGAAGGGANQSYYTDQSGGGGGGYSIGTIAVTAGQTLTLTVGQGGVMNSTASTYGGGGAGGDAGLASVGAVRIGASGGGMSAIWAGTSKTAAATRLVAGGGGGASPGADVNQPRGGGGGGPNGGQDGIALQSGRAGTQTAGGAAATGTSACTLAQTAGAQFQGGRGGSASNSELSEGGGGGGGGWFGGGGGVCQNSGAQNGTGGGGSGYIGGTGVSGASTNAGQNYIWSSGACNTSVVAASGGASDPFYVSGIGVGQCFGNGGNGQIVIQWSGPPTLTITKITNGGAGTFTFTGDNGWTSQAITTTTSGVGVTGAMQALTAAAATTITETMPAGYALTSVACTGLAAGGTFTPNLAAGSVTFNAAAFAGSADVACTFTNSGADMSIDLSGLPDGAAGNQFYSGTFTCTNVGGRTMLAVCTISGLPSGLTTSCSPDMLATLAPGAAITCTVFGQPVITSAGTITLTGVTAAEFDDVNPANNTATRLLNVVPTVAFIDSFRVEFAGPGRALVSWSTRAERGVAGFHVERQVPTSGSWRRLGAGRLLPGLVVAPQGGDYQLLDPEAKAGETYSYRLIEHDVRGVEYVYGPWRVTVPGAPSAGAPPAQGNGAQSRVATGPWTALRPGYAARRHLPRPTPRAAAGTLTATSIPASTAMSARVAATAPLAATAAALSAVAPATAPVTGVRLRTTAAGLYGLDAAALNQSAAMLGLDGATLRARLRAGRMRLESGGVIQPYLYNSTADSLSFFAAAHETAETGSNISRLSLAAGLRLPVMSGSGPAPGEVRAFRDVQRFKQRNTDSSVGYLLFPWAHNEPDAEIWFWDYVYAPEKPKATLNVALTDPAAQGQGTIRVYLRGVSNERPGPDHRASLALNGAPLTGSVEWDGNSAAVLEAQFDQSALGPIGADGTAPLRLDVTGVALPGEDYSYFLIDRVEVEYDRVMRARQGGITLRRLPAGVNAVDGLVGSGPVTVIENPGSAQARKRDDITVSAGALGRKVSFVAAATADYLVAEASGAPALEADSASTLKRAAHNARYLIVAPRAFAGAAQALAARRSASFQGSVEIAWLDDIYDEFSFGRASAQAIADFLGHAYKFWRVSPRYVVLLGRGTLDHRDVLGLGESVIPLRLAPTSWGLAVSDNRYADLNGDGPPELALGRIAASTNAAAQAYVDKLAAFEAVSPEGWSRRATIVADNPDAGGNFTTNSNGIAALIGRHGYTATKLYQTTGATNLRDMLLANWRAGSAYVNYNGHSSYTQLGDSSENYLLARDAAVLGNGARLPVLAAMSCAVADSSNPGTLSLADALVLQPDGGAIAVYGASGLSIDVNAMTLNRSFIRALFGWRWPIGAAAVQASRDAAAGSGAIQRFMHDIYPVAGDPAVRLR